MHRNTHDTAPDERREDTGDSAYEIGRRTVLATTGTITGTVLGAGCLGGDTGSSGGSNDPTGSYNETATETTTEYESPTDTEAATETGNRTELPAEFQKRAKRGTRLLQSKQLADDAYDVAADERNRWTYNRGGETEQGGTEYERLMDVWVDDSVDPLGSYGREELLSQEGIGDALTVFILGWSNEEESAVLAAENRSPSEPQVVEHTYRFQQGRDYGAPFAAASVPPTIGGEIKEAVRNDPAYADEREKYADGALNDIELLRIGVADYFRDHPDRITVQA